MRICRSHWKPPRDPVLSPYIDTNTNGYTVDTPTQHPNRAQAELAHQLVKPVLGFLFARAEVILLDIAEAAGWSIPYFVRSSRLLTPSTGGSIFRTSVDYA